MALNCSELVLRTGYFAKAQQYADAGFSLVSIALKPAWFLPKELTLYRWGCVCPTEEILALKNEPEKYIVRYWQEVLSKINPEVALGKLERIADDSKSNKLVLLCWEAPDKFCHRHEVARWLSGLGLPCKEFSAEDVA